MSQIDAMGERRNPVTGQMVDPGYGCIMALGEGLLDPGPTRQEPSVLLDYVAALAERLKSEARPEFATPASLQG
jgi:hypothetical protein